MYYYFSGPIKLHKSEANQGFVLLNIKGKIYSWTRYTLWKTNSICVLGIFTPSRSFYKNGNKTHQNLQ